MASSEAKGIFVSKESKTPWRASELRSNSSDPPGQPLHSLHCPERHKAQGKTTYAHSRWGEGMEPEEGGEVIWVMLWSQMTAKPTYSSPKEHGSLTKAILDDPKGAYAPQLWLFMLASLGIYFCFLPQGNRGQGLVSPSSGFQSLWPQAATKCPWPSCSHTWLYTHVLWFQGAWENWTANFLHDSPQTLCVHVEEGDTLWRTFIFFRFLKWSPTVILLTYSVRDLNIR